MSTAKKPSDACSVKGCGRKPIQIVMREPSKLRALRAQKVRDLCPLHFYGGRELSEGACEVVLSWAQSRGFSLRSAFRGIVFEWADAHAPKDVELCMPLLIFVDRHVSEIPIVERLRNFFTEDPSTTEETLLNKIILEWYTDEVVKGAGAAEQRSEVKA